MTTIATYFESRFNTKKISEAMKFAKEKHAGQTRKFSGKPYVSHPADVMNIIQKFKSTSKNLEALKIASLLHDTLEDTDTTPMEIKKLFGNMVMSIVQELTSDSKKIEDKGKEKYLSEKMSNDLLSEKMSNDLTDYALVIKLADRLSNVKDIGTAKKSFADKYGKETRAILTSLTRDRKLTATQNKLVAAIDDHISQFGY